MRVRSVFYAYHGAFLLIHLTQITLLAIDGLGPLGGVGGGNGLGALPARAVIPLALVLPRHAPPLTAGRTQRRWRNGLLLPRENRTDLVVKGQIPIRNLERLLTETT